MRGRRCAQKGQGLQTLLVCSTDPVGFFLRRSVYTYDDKSGSAWISLAPSNGNATGRGQRAQCASLGSLFTPIVILHTSVGALCSCMCGLTCSPLLGILIYWQPALGTGSAHALWSASAALPACQGQAACPELQQRCHSHVVNSLLCNLCPRRLASSAANANSDIVSPFGLTTIAPPTAQPVAAVAPGQVLSITHD